jgi:hypothetical protein
VCQVAVGDRIEDIRNVWCPSGDLFRRLELPQHISEPLASPASVDLQAYRPVGRPPRPVDARRDLIWAVTVVSWRFLPSRVRSSSPSAPAVRIALPPTPAAVPSACQ